MWEEKFQITPSNFRNSPPPFCLASRVAHTSKPHHTKGTTMTTQAIAERIAANKLLRIQEVSSMTSLCKVTIYALMRDGDFPRPVLLSKKRIAWKQADVLEWLESRKAQAA
jgi:prophage regulatory protein